MSDRIRSPGDDVAHLRRRLWIERAVSAFLLLVLVSLYLGFVPGGRRTTLIAVEGKPVAVVATRGDAVRLLGEVKASTGQPPDQVSFAQKVTLHEVSAAKSPPEADSDVLTALSEALQPVVSAAAIVANGEVVLALPTQAEAVRTLSLIVREFSPAEQTGTVYFRQSVRVEGRQVRPELLYESAAAAMEKIVEGTAPKAEHAVQPGDSAWKLARDYDVPLSRLAAANPDLDLERLPLGAKVKIPGELPPLTVIARRDIEEPFAPGSPRMRKVRITYENGVEVKREVIKREILPAPRPAPERAAARAGASTEEPWRWRDERSGE